MNILRRISVSEVHAFHKNREFFSQERELFLCHIDPSRPDKDGLSQYECKICSTCTYVYEEQHPGKSPTDYRACPYGKDQVQ